MQHVSANALHTERKLTETQQAERFNNTGDEKTAQTPWKSVIQTPCTQTKAFVHFRAQHDETRVSIVSKTQWREDRDEVGDEAIHRGHSPQQTQHLPQAMHGLRTF